jgi:hypothetical protein
MRALAWILTMGMILVLAGCSGSSQEEGTASDDAATAETHGTVATTETAGETVTLAGTTGCGHCNFHIGDGCAAAMKTADGTIYIIDGVDHGSDLFTKRMEEKPVTVVGTVSEIDGVQHVDLTSYELN